MTSEPFSFVTDTATMCAFDLKCLKHRLNDDADWWTTPDAELEEVNAGNVAFFGLGGDGRYEVSIVQALPDYQVKLNVRAPSGVLFIGAGEEVTSDGLEPKAVRGGSFVAVPPGSVTLFVKKKGKDVSLMISPGAEGRNSMLSPIRLDQ